MKRRGRVQRVATWTTALASGVGITVAISWAIGTIVPVGDLHGFQCARKSAPGETRFRPELVFVLERRAGPGVRWLTVGIQRGADPHDWLPDPELRTPVPEDVLDRWELRRFAEERREFELQRNPSGYSASHFEARGWPLPALWCEHDAGTPAVRGGFEIRGAHHAPWMARRMVRRTLPYRPLWIGLLVDTALWSSVTGLLLFIPGAIRRVRRRRAGQCPACGDDLAGLGGRGGAACPECGERR